MRRFVDQAATGGEALSADLAHARADFWARRKMDPETSSG
jgi:hypothetical protein